jgi:mono/diheme cytochrome c family protein
VARGRELFQQNCIVCHGAEGRGDGPQAAQLDPAPSDFRLHLPLHTDPQFYAFIANGYPGSAMPAFRDQFSEEDIWNLVNFLRASFSEAPAE